MIYTKILKVLVFLALLLSLVSCNSSQTQSIIYRLEDDGYPVEPIDFDQVNDEHFEFEVSGAINVYEIYNRMDKIMAYLYEFENEEELIAMFEDMGEDVETYEGQIYENILVVPYENIDYITNIMIIIKR